MLDSGGSNGILLCRRLAPGRPSDLGQSFNTTSSLASTFNDDISKSEDVTGTAKAFINIDDIRWRQIVLIGICGPAVDPRFRFTSGATNDTTMAMALDLTGRWGVD